MLKLLEKLFAGSQATKSGLNQSQREAVIDLLLLAIYADNHISLDENQVLEDSIDSLGWNSGTGLSMYINDATTRVRNAQNDEASTNEFIDTIATRLDSQRSKDKALSLLVELFDSDGTSVAEESFYTQLQSKLAS